jgi:hypothetical protein
MGVIFQKGACPFFDRRPNKKGAALVQVVNATLSLL